MKTGRIIALVFLGLAIVGALLPLGASILYLVTGSLEMTPTPEQQGKARIAGTLATAVFGVLELLLIAAFVAVIRKKRGTQNIPSEHISEGRKRPSDNAQR
jgi:hypothetical protein